MFNKQKGGKGQMEVKSLINDFFKVQANKTEDKFEIYTSIMIFANIPLVFYVEKCDEGYKITDRKLVCMFLSKLYDLTSNDVKSCIQEVLGLNKMSLKKGEIFAVAKTDADFKLALANFVVCVSQLIRMQAFFEKAEN